MAKHPLFRRLPPLLAAGLIIYLLPATALALPGPGRTPTPAVASVSPLSLQPDPAGDYRAAAGRLAGLGLDTEQIRVLWGRMGEQLLSRLDTGELSRQDLDFLSVPYGREALLERYAAYALAAPERPAQEVVLQVNMGLDRDFYEQIQTVADPGSPAVLVNKYNALPKDYVPELVALKGLGSGSLTPQAAQAFGEMAAAAQEDGVTLRSVSAYRSYATQAGLYQRYTAQSGRALADTFSARPGYSEHQTGLALDINTASTSAHFENTTAYAWLVEHCAQYGFILRYPQDKQAVTGYRFEPWHYRYVGVETARVCMEQGLTYEEFLARQTAPGSSQPPALIYQGQALELGSEALMLQGGLYLSPQALAQALGWSAAQDGGVLVLSQQGRRATVQSGRRCQVNGVTLLQTAPPLELDGGFFLSLDDLCAALGLSARETQAGVELTSLSGDSPILA